MSDNHEDQDALINDDGRPTEVDPPGGPSASAPPQSVRPQSAPPAAAAPAAAAPAAAAPAAAPAQGAPFPEEKRAGSGLLFALGGLVLILGMCGLVFQATSSAQARLLNPDAEGEPQVAIADQAEVPYCTPQFKQVLERVLHACGLEGGTSRRGCQPSDVKTLASISDDDFNALFTPLKERGAVLLFDNASDELDPGGKALLEERWADRRGARYFFVVARASKVGNQDRNRALSHRRANSVKFHVDATYQDPDIDKKLGQLWLGSEFAQLGEDFCQWPHSRADGKCDTEAINRSVFVSWVDCRL